MTAGALLLAVVAATHPPGPVQAAGQAPEVVAEIRVHGNHVTPDAEVIRLAGIAIGDPVGPGTLAAIERRLRDSGRFQDIEVLRRYASIADPTKIAIVIIANEGAVRIQAPSVPGAPIAIVRRRGLRNMMVMPILDAEDGYGLTYGAQLAWPSVTGDLGRVSVPLTWGGFKRAGVQFDRAFRSGPLSRIEAGAAIQRRRNPFFEEEDDRRRVWGRAERAVGPLRAGAGAGWQRVSFGAIDEDVRSVRADVALDTRLDPTLPRNAVYLAASRERFFFEGGRETDRWRLDGRGWVGLIGQTVLAVRASREDASGPLPPYLKPLLGGTSTLRGFRAGSFAGDRVVTGSAELLIPVSSPLSAGRLGVSVFVDAGVAYDRGERFGDRRLERGAGGSVWLSLPGFRLSLSVARGIGAGTRVNFGGGLAF